jgi:hypothetical protein
MSVGVIILLYLFLIPVSLAVMLYRTARDLGYLTIGLIFENVILAPFWIFVLIGWIATNETLVWKRKD